LRRVHGPAPAARASWTGGAPPIAVGRQFGDDRLDLGHQFVVRSRGPTDPLLGPFLETVRKIGAGDADYPCHGLHREPSFGGDGGSRSCFFDPVACSRASLRIFASSVFFPRSRLSSRTWFCKARYSEAGTTSSPLPAAVRLPCATSRRQVNNWFGATPCRRATRLTVIPGSKVSSTMRTFSGAVQRRRR